MRLIDADALMDKMRRNPLFERTERDKGMFYVERSVINVMPTIDAVEVVRCKDCHFWSNEANGLGDERVCRRISVKGLVSNYTRPEGFCSYGERKETE